ncbi:prepilin-type N-terminal cleavage/methylation domain-containing protein [Limnohabitans sp.]|uniref:prepilin-type N-terminal cleavage/methylation domain-containing protein n=1 Tax=Limnohabitans sp. TaxID=1907725 RepID=UPI003340A8AC
MQRQQGFTLLELLVVLAIIGFAMAGVSLSLRDSSQTQIEREAQRLVAVLEAARAQSRTSGIALIWQPTTEGFVIRPALAPNPAQANNPIAARTEKWLAIGTQASVSAANLVVLGPEPILTAARITLSVANTNSNSAKPATSLSIGTDGLRPFQVMP